MAKAKKRVSPKAKSKNPKFLVVFYSRTGTTKRLAEAISIVLKCDIDEIREPTDRNGVLGYLRSGKESAWRELPKILKPIKNPENYDVVILGTPVWSATMSSPVRSYINENREKIKKLAFFSSCSSVGGITFIEMEKFSKKKPLATMELKTYEIMKGGYIQKINDFIARIKENL